jgi:hypothetical protein
VFCQRTASLTIHYSHIIVEYSRSFGCEAKCDNEGLTRMADSREVAEPVKLDWPGGRKEVSNRPKSANSEDTCTLHLHLVLCAPSVRGCFALARRSHAGQRRTMRNPGFYLVGEPARSLLEALQGAGIIYELPQSKRGNVIMNSSEWVDLAKFALNHADWPMALAWVFVAWLRKNRQRKIIVTLPDETIVQTEALNADDFAKVLAVAHHVAVMDSPGKAIRRKRTTPEPK